MDPVQPYAIPRGDSEPPLPQAAGAGAARVTVYALLGLMLLGGAWVRFNDRIAAFAPVLAEPAAQVADQAGDSARVKSLVELPLLPASATADALTALRLPAAELAAVTQAVEQRRLRLVRLPLFDASATINPNVAGRVVSVSAGGYTRLVRLTRQPVVVTLPIATVGLVSFRGADQAAAGPIGIGAITVSGPTRLPDIAAGETLNVGVVAQ